MNEEHGIYSGVVDIARNGVDEVIRLRALNADLLDALRSLIAATEGVSINDYNEEVHDISLSKARAALAKAER